MFKLVIQDDEGKTTVVPLIRDEITIGRKEGNTIRLTERNVSRRHARILRNAGEVHIEDLGSYNGIRVNNSRIAERVSLRVSDQVQIGDYKLYLKAEGVEQVDDARTMPIERVEGVNGLNGGATEVMPAVPAIAATAAAPTAPQLVGNPARTLVAIADTDPQGRPVATAATVAALTAPAQYGKLCVISSNFAGKEFELSRPQMIVGRTEENDIVINHRSISRNHAKLVREPDTARYTISDLQSSNGVRVNGQDYGKVELRRGDVVDLGHVRLRFIEPGDDWVFTPSAVADVPDSNSKKGLLVAIVLGVVVLGAVAAFFLFKNNGSDEQKSAKPGSDHTEIGSNNGTDVAIVTPNVGSGQGQTVEPVPADAATVVPTVAVDSATKALLTRCAEAQNKRKWADLQNCANDLQPHDKDQSTTLLKKAELEAKSEQASIKVAEAVKGGNLKGAASAMAKVNEDSVYFGESKAAYDKLERTLTDDAKKRLQALADGHDCKRFDKLVAEYKVTGLSNPAGELRCEPSVAVAPVEHQPDHPVEHQPDHPKNPTNGSAEPQIKPPPPVPCDVDALKAKGELAHNSGDYGTAITSYRAAYKCKAEMQTLTKGYLSSCKAVRADDAKFFFRQMPASIQSSTNIIQICMNSGIDIRK